MPGGRLHVNLERFIDAVVVKSAKDSLCSKGLGGTDSRDDLLSETTACSGVFEG